MNRGSPSNREEIMFSICSIYAESVREFSNKECQAACKPGSVPACAGDGHSSGTPVTGRLSRPTRTATRKRVSSPAEARNSAVPIWSCSRWGLPCRFRCRSRGALLPHPFTLTRCRAEAWGRAVCFLWHFPWGRPRRTLSGTVFPWSPDFPPPDAKVQGRPSGRLTRPHFRAWRVQVKCRQV